MTTPETLPCHITDDQVRCQSIWRAKRESWFRGHGRFAMEEPRGTVAEPERNRQEERHGAHRLRGASEWKSNARQRSSPETATS